MRGFYYLLVLSLSICLSNCTTGGQSGSGFSLGSLLEAGGCQVLFYNGVPFSRNGQNGVNTFGTPSCPSKRGDGVQIWRASSIETSGHLAKIRLLPNKEGEVTSIAIRPNFDPKKSGSFRYAWSKS